MLNRQPEPELPRRIWFFGDTPVPQTPPVFAVTPPTALSEVLNAPATLPEAHVTPPPVSSRRSHRNRRSQQRYSPDPF